MDIVNAFNNSIKASIDTLLQIDSQRLIDSSPQDFVFGYCARQLEPFGIKLIDYGIQKEAELSFYSLSERQNEFSPIVSMRDLNGIKRFQVIINARAMPFECVILLVYSIENKSAALQDVKIDDIKLLRGDSRSFIPLVKSFESFVRPVVQSSIATIIIEGIKKMLSG